MRQIIIVSLLLAFTLPGCGEQEPIKIGFIGSLSGRDAEVSQAARNGVILALEEANVALSELKARKIRGAKILRIS